MSWKFDKHQPVSAEIDYGRSTGEKLSRKMNLIFCKILWSVVWMAKFHVETDFEQKVNTKWSLKSDLSKSL